MATTLPLAPGATSPTSPTVAYAPTFRPMEPEMQAFYDQLMQHADNCRSDIETHEHNMAMFMCMTGGGQAFAGMRSIMGGLAQQSQLMEEEARELAYMLLKSHGPATA